MHAAIDRAARTGRGLPRLRQTPDTSYEPSEKSNVTDLGARARELQDEKTDKRRDLAEPLWPHRDVQIPLQDRLLGILQKIPGHDEKKGFFPEKKLTDMMTEECIRKELQLCSRQQLTSTLNISMIEDIVKLICGTAPTDGERRKYKKIFTILVLCERPEAILQFLEEKVSDQDLPLRKSSSTDGSPNIFHMARKGHQDRLECFRGWSSAAVWRFEEWQWTTLAPFFYHGQRKDIKHFILQDQVPLPINSDSRFPSRDSPYQRLEFAGGFSNVFKVSLHPEHHDLYEPGVSLLLHTEIHRGFSEAY